MSDLENLGILFRLIERLGESVKSLHDEIDTCSRFDIVKFDEELEEARKIFSNQLK